MSDEPPIHDPRHDEDFYREQAEGDCPASVSYDDLLEKSLMAYEVANFREWDKDAAIYRYRNHAATHQAVKAIAYIFSHNSKSS